MLLQAASAAGAGVVTEYAQRKNLVGTSSGLIAALALLGIGYFMAPTSRGSMLPVTAGMVDGAATWLGMKYIVPVVAPGFRYRGMPVPRPAFVPATAGRSGGSVMEI